MKPQTPAPRPQDPPLIRRCAKGGCKYLLQEDDGGLRECGEPAVVRSGHGLLYCQMHGQTVKDACDRKRVALTLTPWNTGRNSTGQAPISQTPEPKP